MRRINSSGFRKFNFKAELKRFIIISLVVEGAVSIFKKFVKPKVSVVYQHLDYEPTGVKCEDDENAVPQPNGKYVSDTYAID